MEGMAKGGCDVGQRADREDEEEVLEVGNGAK